MNIYIVIINDRHSNVEAIPFYKKSDAIECAKKTAKEYCRRIENLQENVVNDFIYYIEYSCEGDCIWVVKEEIN